jgi:hypothetical protein
VRDVVEGWSHPGGGMEFEKGLRKTAQRGGESALPFSKRPSLSLLGMERR